MFLKCFGFGAQRQYPTVIEELCHRFSLADLRKSTNNFDQDTVTGHGRFSRVYKGCLQHNEDASEYTVAVKRFVRVGVVEKWFRNEIELLCQLRHPNLVSLIGFCNDQNEMIIVYEYMSNGSLHQLLQSGILSWKKRLEICIGAARGLHYLHAGAKRTIIHRYINSRNILLDHNMQPKLAEFVLSVQGARFMSKPKPIQVDQIIGSGGYMAREYATHGTVTDKSDVFSFGGLLLDVVCGRKYIRGNQGETEFLEKPLEEKIDEIIEGSIAPECWQVFVDITLRCVKLEPDERPTMGEVEVELEHALSLQEQADIVNTNADYTLMSKTVIPRDSFGFFLK
ncbi:hypothetical protein GLYMA_18G272500v4 [Glycine max]|nr:hypothetical protein GLYMA_18G272500v4 [Glycine max]KAH1156382.1 hypothetical protein GYH30_051268 [Glycine max]